MNKTALALSLISALLFSVVGAKFVGLAGANPYGSFWDNIWPLPGTNPPKIKILSPKNHTSYSSGDLNLTVDVSMLEPAYPADFGASSVSCFLDGLEQQSLGSNGSLLEVKINEVMSNLRSGSHVLEVRAGCWVFPRDFNVFFIDSKSTVYFTIDNSPSSPSPSPSPDAKTTESLPTSLVMASSVTLAVVLVGLGLLLYGIKRKQSQPPPAEVV